MSREKQIEGMIEAIEKCSCVYTECEQECSQCSNEELYDDTINHIARTVYEAGYRKQKENTVEVVRCKDCKYHRDLDGGVKCERMDGLLMTLPNDFCSYGAKMKGGEE